MKIKSIVKTGLLILGFAKRIRKTLKEWNLWRAKNPPSAPVRKKKAKKK